MTKTCSTNLRLKNTPIQILNYFENEGFKTCSLKNVEFTTGFFNFSGIIYIKKGRISISLPQQNLDTIYSFILEANSWFGGLTLMPLPHPFILINEIDQVEVLYIAKDQLTEIADANPLIYKWLLKIAAENIPQWLQVPLIALSNKKLRVTYCLATLLPTNKGNISTMVIDVSQQKISDICGLSRPRVNEVLKELEQEGLLQVKHKKIIIINPKGMFKLLDEANLCFYDPREKNKV
ncbi:MAG: Crp/Fnr family transcriptional regulator [Colwellia sp.]|nr:Crp/Fnr family transcriptional regulator [Colwellia sp.]